MVVVVVVVVYHREETSSIVYLKVKSWFLREGNDQKSSVTITGALAKK
jgi:hypothetical protein